MKSIRAAVAGFLAISAAAPAQEVPLRTTSPLVVVPVSVRDRRGQRIAALSAGDFLVTDRGRPVEIRVEEDSTPLSIAVLVQTSRVAGPALERLRRNVTLLTPLVAGWQAEGALFAYDSEVRPLVSFTTNIDKVEGAMVGLLPRTSLDARLHDGLLMAARELKARRASRRRILLVIGETRDRGSEVRIEDAITALQLANTTVYWLSYSPMLTGLAARQEDQVSAPASSTRTRTSPTMPSPVEGAPGPPGIDLGGLGREAGRLSVKNSADALTRSTGGFETSFVRGSGLEDAITRIGQELHMQYVLTFRPSPATESEWRELVVKVTTRRDARVRHRPGYFIAPE